MNYIVLANFKSHKTSKELESWINTVSPVATDSIDKVTLLVAPSMIHIPVVSNLLPQNPNLQLCSQDVSPFPPGSYTGAVNAPQLKEYGVKYGLIGHTERRRYFHETHPDIANKAKELLAVGITPAICLAKEDIEPQFAALDDDLQHDCIYCFEPPADIGGTVAAPAEVIEEALAMIRRYVSAPVLYGGSVTKDNITSLLKTSADGVLVATASLDPVNFNQLITQVAHAR
ncbi:MAG: triosephosphate isomerase [Thiothrix sp.]|nr:MAG: triosephosphate isomerase [Thiothrix sp.]